MRTRAGLLVLASAAAVASLSGCGHASRSSSSLRHPPRSYSVRQVKTAFAAVGLPLVETPGGELGYTFLQSRAYVETGIELSVTVNPRVSPNGEYAWSAFGPDVPDADIDASATGNVVVVFDRRSPSAPRIRAALARLRRL